METIKQTVYRDKLGRFVHKFNTNKHSEYACYFNSQVNLEDFCNAQYVRIHGGWDSFILAIPTGTLVFIPSAGSRHVIEDIKQK